MRAPWILASIAALAVALPVACGGGTTSTGTTGTGGSSATTTTAVTTTTTGGGGGSTTGTGGSSMLAVCDAPAQSPSKGACFQPGGGGMGGATTSTSSTGGAGGAGGTGGAGGSTGAGGAGGSTGAGGAGGSAGAGGAPAVCTMILAPSACATCLEGGCCGELAACNDAGDCLACVIGQETNPAKCNAEPAKTAALALTSCIAAQCKAPCAPPPQCNPVTNEGCNAMAGEACDLGQTGFHCYAAPNDQELCAACDQSSGPYCKAGMHCMTDGACARYCCDDGDCGTGVCDKSILAHPTIGVCVHKP